MAHREQTLHTGVLFKRGSGTDYPFGRTNWKTRYFVLTPSTLAYYTYEGGQWKGEVELSSKPTRKATSSEQEQQQQQHATIEVMPADSKKTGRSASTIWRIAVNAPERRLLLAAGSEWEMNVWVEKLQLALRLARSGAPLDRQPQQLTHRMSLPVASNTFVTDFQTVNAQRQRQSIAAIGGAGSEWSRQPELWELPLTESTLQAVVTPPASSSSASILSPQEPGAFDQVMSNEYYGDDTFEYPDSIPIMGTMTPPPYSSSRAASLFEHQRLSLPSAVEAHVFSGKRSSSVLSTQPSVSSIVDFQNFARSRRRLSVDGGARLRRELSLQQTQRLSTDVYGAGVELSRRVPEEKEDDGPDEKPRSNSEESTTTRKQEGERNASSLVRDAAPESTALQRARRHRFARLRKWLSFKRKGVEV